jgi:hypothetical protein
MGTLRIAAAAQFTKTEFLPAAGKSPRSYTGVIEIFPEEQSTLSPPSSQPVAHKASQSEATVEATAFRP